ncbi:MAG: 50S ribosomal protein L14e [Methanobacteriota archaeon]|nr:MAG: 50S ribosomal protein L14e [Euryarchaeota archaeon]
MAAIEKGRVVIITRGSEAGKEAEVVDVVDRNMLLVKVGNKERKVSIKHVEPTTRKA